MIIAPILSIIIPVYDTEHYIGDCLTSVFDQDINESNYEVICVDDCSPDKAVEIITEFQKSHENLSILKHSKNRGLGATRNTGLSAAKGKYVWFVDSDDIVRDNCFKEIIECCEKNNLEIFHWAVMDDKFAMVYPVTELGVVSGVVDVVKGNNPYWFAWDRVYNREFLLNNNLWFSELKNGDILHTLSALNLAKRVMCCNIGYYYYRKDRPGSAMSTKSLSATGTYKFSYLMGRELYHLSTVMHPELSVVVLEHAKRQANSAARMSIKLPFREKLLFCKVIDKNLKNELWCILNSSNKVVLSCPIVILFFHIPYLFVHFLRNLNKH